MSRARRMPPAGRARRPRRRALRRLLAPVVAALVLAPAPAPAAERLDRLAGELRTERLAVHPDVAYLLDAEQRAALRATLADTRVPVYVALLPALDEDESGGDQARQLRALYDRVGEAGVYVVVDQDGRMNLADAEIPLRLSLDYGTLAGPSSFEEVAPDETLPARLATILDVVADAPAAAPAPFDTGLGGDGALPELRTREGDGFTALAILYGVGGLFLGGLLFGVTVLAAAMVRRRA